MSGWIRVDAGWWESVAESIEKPWPREAALIDLRWHDDQSMDRGRVYFEERWGWSKRQVVSLRSSDDWRDKFKGGTRAGRGRDAGGTPANGLTGTIERFRDASGTPAGRERDALLDHVHDHDHDLQGGVGGGGTTPAYRVVNEGASGKPSDVETVAHLVQLQRIDGEELCPPPRMGDRGWKAVERALLTGWTAEEVEEVIQLARVRDIRTQVWPLLLGPKFEGLQTEARKAVRDRTAQHELARRPIGHDPAAAERASRPFREPAPPWNKAAK